MPILLYVSSKPSYTQLFIFLHKDKYFFITLFPFKQHLFCFFHDGCIVSCNLFQFIFYLCNFLFIAFSICFIHGIIQLLNFLLISMCKVIQLILHHLIQNYSSLFFQITFKLYIIITNKMIAFYACTFRSSTICMFLPGHHAFANMNATVIYNAGFNNFIACSF